MTPGLFLLVAAGGGLGAVLRLVVDGLVSGRTRSGFPWGTFWVNVSGSFLLGLLTGLAASSRLDAPWLVVLGAGVLGGYTTFSTAMVATVAELQRGAVLRALGNGLGMLVVTIAVALAGLALGRAV